MELLRQNPDLIYIVYTGVALGAFLVFTGISQMLSRRESATEAKSRRMKMIAEGASTEELLAILKPPSKGGILSNLPFVGDLERDLSQSGLSIKPLPFLFICSVLALSAAVFLLAYMGPFQSLATGFVAGFGLPIVVVKSRRKERINQLIMQLPDALDLMARGLRVGHPLNTSIGAVAEEMEDPIATEFGIIFDQVSFGDDLPDAFAEFAERVDIEDVYYLSASVGIQHGTGGDLARVISVLGKVIRNRISMRRKIAAISSEGRLTAYFLSALPLLIFGATSVTNPSYYWGVADEPMARMMAVVIVGLTILNALILRKLVNFRI